MAPRTAIKKTSKEFRLIQLQQPIPQSKPLAKKTNINQVQLKNIKGMGLNEKIYC